MHYFKINILLTCLLYIDDLQQPGQENHNSITDFYAYLMHQYYHTDACMNIKLTIDEKEEKYAPAIDHIKTPWNKRNRKRFCIQRSIVDKLIFLEYTFTPDFFLSVDLFDSVCVPFHLLLRVFKARMNRHVLATPFTVDFIHSFTSDEIWKYESILRSI